MHTARQGLLGVQLMLIGLYFVTYFDGVSSLPMAGLFLGVVETIVTFAAVATPDK